MIIFIETIGMIYYSRRNFHELGDLKEQDCFFCKLDTDNLPRLIKYYDDTIGVIRNGTPYGRVHFIAFPIKHMKDTSVFDYCPENVRLYHNMIAALRTELEKCNEPRAKTIPIYFHFPPMLSIDHLHLHACDEIFDNVQWVYESFQRICHVFAFYGW
jgi:diadenosine tetraphosphate (Ap4A) HIT family hydrolase